MHQGHGQPPAAHGLLQPGQAAEGERGYAHPPAHPQHHRHRRHGVPDGRLRGR